MLADSMPSTIEFLIEQTQNRSAKTSRRRKNLPDQAASERKVTQHQNGARLSVCTTLVHKLKARTTSVLWGNKAAGHPQLAQYPGIDHL
jgi:hypothetical protein